VALTVAFDSHSWKDCGDQAGIQVVHVVDLLGRTGDNILPSPPGVPGCGRSHLLQASLIGQAPGGRGADLRWDPGGHSGWRQTGGRGRPDIGGVRAF